MLNESAYLNAARHLAQNVVAKAESTEDRVNVAYETGTGKLPDDEELRMLSTLATDMHAMYEESPELAKEMCDGLELADDQSAELAGWTVVVNTLYNLDITKNKD